MSFLYDLLPDSETDKIASAFGKGDTSAFSYGKSGLTQKKGGLEQAGGMLEKVFGNAQKRQERDALMNSLFNRAGQPFGGAGLSGRTTSLADGSLTQISPDSFTPIVFPGGSGGVAGGKGTGQRIAGAAKGALSGAKVGSAILPGWGTAIGAGIGALGGLFG